MKRLILLALLLCCSVPSWATWTRVRHVTKSCGTASSCAIAITATAAGNLGVIVVGMASSTVTISSASGGGTWTHPGTCHATGSSQGIDFIYNLSLTAGVTSVTVNLSGSTTFDAFYYEYSGTSSPFIFDVCGLANSQATTTTPKGGQITTTGANDVAIAMFVSAGTATAGAAVSPSPWTTPILDAISADGIGATDALNFAATTTQPTFASSSAVACGASASFKETVAAGGTAKRRVVIAD